MKNVLTFLLLCSLLACKSDDKSTEQAPINEKDMINIMVDLAISDAMVEHELLPTNQLIYQKKLTFYEDIFEHHGYTAEEFEEAYLIYAQDLGKLDAMYDQVLEKLSEKEIELKSVQDE